MPTLSLTQAAKVTHQSKATILEAIFSGRLSARRDHLNQWQIDPEDLFRVYPQPRHPIGEEDSEEAPEEDQERRQTALFFVTLRQLNAQLVAQSRIAERERRLLEATISDLRTDRDHWRAQAARNLRRQPPLQEPLKRHGQPRGSFRERSLRLLLIIAAASLLAWLYLRGGITLAVSWP